MNKSGKPDGRGRHGKHAKGSRHGRWVGGKMVDKSGYILVRVGRKYVQEHRLVMEKIIGRKLLKHEHVHHKNENKADNREENLLIVSINEHRRIHAIQSRRDSHGRFSDGGVHGKPLRNELGQYIGNRHA